MWANNLLVSSVVVYGDWGSQDSPSETGDGEEKESQERGRGLLVSLLQQSLRFSRSPQTAQAQS